MASSSIPAEALKLQDIALFSAKFEQPIEFEQGRHAGKYQIRGNHRVKAETAEVVDSEGVERRALRVFVELHVEALLNDDFELADASQTSRTLFAVSAMFLLSFTIESDLAENVMLDFIRINCPMLAWPFWRHHVFDTLKSASLPPISVPLLAVKSPLLNPNLIGRTDNP